MNRPSLDLRLLLGFLLVAVLPLLGLAWLYLNSFEQALTATVLQKVSSIADKKADQVDAFINERLDDARLIAQGRGTREALSELSRDFRRGGLAATAEADRRYRQSMLLRAETGQYHDLLLIDAAGNVVFSLKREPDLGTNLNSGPYRDTGLALGWHQAVQTLQTDLTVFMEYAPSGNKVAAFMVAPVFEAGRPIGALALQLNIDALTAVVTDFTGLGRSGEAAVAQRSGNEVLYTAPLRGAPGAAFGYRISFARAPLPMQKALSGEHGSGITRDYGGTSVAAAWRYLPALGWGMNVKIDSAEAFAPAHKAQRFTVLALAAFLLFSGVAAKLLGRHLVATERMIASQEARFRAMFGSMNEGVALCQAESGGKDFVFLDYNRAAEQITHLTREQVIGRGVTEMFPGVAEAGILDLFRRVWQTGQAEALPFADYHDHRLSLWLEINISRMPGGEILAVFRDIRERKQAEDALRLYAKVFQHSGEAIMITDHDNGIVAVNPAFTRLTGYAQSELRGENPRVLASGRTPPGTYEAMWTALMQEGHWQGELWDRRKGGHVYPKWMSVVAVRNPDGAVTNYIASFSDITERKEAFEQVRRLNEELEERVEERTHELALAKEQAEKANMAKSEFLARMSHELRTPLNAVLGFSQLLEADPHEPLSKSQLESVQIIQQAGRHLLDLINEVLDLAKVEAGRFQLDMQPVDVSAIAMHCESLIRPLATAQGITLRNEVTDTPCFILADAVRTKQVLINLLSNAIKYNQPNGSVIISSREDPDGFVRIAVADTGHGIPQEKQHLLFQPFQRLEADPYATEGTGIGLALTKKLVDLMGGQIGVSSEAGVGSTFTVAFRRAELTTADANVNPPENAARRAEGTEAAASSKYLVLYIEDEPANLRLVETLLTRQQSGITMLPAHDGMLGLQLAEAHQPDLILLDINMSGLDGMEVLRRLRAHEQTRGIPVIAISANAMPKDIETALAAGFNSYVTKPIDIQELLAAVARHLQLPDSKPVPDQA